MQEQKTTVGLTIASDFEFVELAELVATNLAKLIEFDEDASTWIGMAVREAVINAIRHGNKQDPNKRVDLRFSLNNDTITVEVIDEGEGFDLRLVPDPLDPENLLKPSGRGIFYMRSFMDRVEFSHPPGGGTVVSMSRRKHSQGEVTSHAND
ncbi:MAG: ATP-binding protein [Acidobacteriota bacterium]|nr:ATP-binding protein [Blastocatellia bacterium]MDW8240600.1 ATP-binding protein [Acidobacteriota bacterium]